MTGGDAIGARPIGAAGLRALSTELSGPRPAGTRDAMASEPETRIARATKP